MLNALGVTLFPTGTLRPEHAARSLLVGLVDYTARATVVLLVAWVVSALLRHRAAATRYAVWAVAIVMVAALPWLSRVTPAIAVSLPAVAPMARTTTGPGLPDAVIAPASSGAPVQPAPSHSARGPAVIPESRGVRTSAAVAHPVRAAIDLPLVVAVVWLAGALCLVLRFGVGTVVVWRRALIAEPVADSEWVMLARDLARELGIRRPVTLLMTRSPTVPVTWGVIYPVLLLPSDAMTWSHARRRAVLLHELAHVARFDAATQLVGQLVLAANWFNPLAWLATARMRAEREGACDDVVLTRGTRASAYAEDLLTLVRGLTPSVAPGFAALAMARRSELEGRLRFILDTRRRRAASSARASVLSLATAAPFVLLLAAVRPSMRAVHAGVEYGRAAPLVAHMAAIVEFVAQAAQPAPRLAVGLQAPQAPALRLPTGVASYRCPVNEDFVHGGVSADGGRPGALEAEHGDRRILVLADDGRCVSGRIDGQVVLNGDASDVSGLGAGGQVVVIDAKDGHTRRAEVTLEGANPKPGYYALGEPLYVIDGVIVEGTTGDADKKKLGIIQQNNIDQTMAASGGARRMLDFHYSVDGQPRPWDEGRDWFHSTLAQLVRESAYDVRNRVIQLWSHGGVPTVLEEIRRIRSEMGVRAYFDALLDVSSGGTLITTRREDADVEATIRARLSPDEAKQAAELARSMLPVSPDRDRIISALLASSNPGAQPVHPF